MIRQEAVAIVQTANNTRIALDLISRGLSPEGITATMDGLASARKITEIENEAIIAANEERVKSLKRQADVEAEIWQQREANQRAFYARELEGVRRQTELLVEAATKGVFSLEAGGFQKVSQATLSRMAAALGTFAAQSQTGRGMADITEFMRSVGGFEGLAPNLLQSVGAGAPVSAAPTFQIVLDGQVIDVLGRVISTRQQQRASTLAQFGV
jgi:hypothetical protein